MLNLELSEIFERIAEILEFLGDSEDIFRVRAYINAAIAVKETSEDDLKKMARERNFRGIHGIGEGITRKIIEYVATGKIKEYEAMKKMIPKGFFEMLGVPSLGPKKVKVLNRELGIEDITQLKRAIEEGKVQALPGFGQRSAQKILEGIAIKAKSKGRFLFGEVYSRVQHIVESLRRCKYIANIEVAGSFRRAEETIGDIDILAAGKNSKAIMVYFKKEPYVEEILSEGGTKTSVLTKDMLQIDLRVVASSQFGSALQYFTGSKKHNIHLRTFAKNRGFKLSEYGFFKGKKLVASKTEKDCYKALGMQYIPPEMRSDAGEIETAYKHKIPVLIENGALKGDLHVHSIWSDGHDSIETMAVEAIKRGYEYIAITDHSPNLPITRGLSPDRLKEKKREIEELNEKLPITILFGAEVDILADGDIDYSDNILKTFDIVVASIHSRFNQDNTLRILRAMRNPYVHIIGHPSGRMIGQRDPYHLDYERLFKQACDTNTVLEINSQYLRFDLQDSQIREAKRWGCKFSINSDAHSASTLWFTDLGIKWARRGWAEERDVINTLSLRDLKKTLK